MHAVVHLCPHHQSWVKGTQNSYEKYFSDQLSLSGTTGAAEQFKICPEPTLLAPSTGAPKYLDGLQLWFDPGLRATEEF